MQNRMEMALAVDVKTDVAADAKTDAAADAEFPAAAAAAETAIVPRNDRSCGCGGTQAADRERRAYRQGYRDGWNWGYWQGWNDAVWGRNGREGSTCEREGSCCGRDSGGCN